MKRCAMVLVVAVLLSACSQTENQVDEVASSESRFEGTPEEYAVLLRACVEERGFETVDDPMGAPDGFAVSLVDANFDEYQEAFDGCNAEIGEPQMKDLPEEELLTRYEARVEQWGCLVDEGFAEGEPISFDVFVEDYNRSGQSVLWEPTEGLEVRFVNEYPIGPTDACPRVGAW